MNLSLSNNLQQLNNKVHIRGENEKYFAFSVSKFLAVSRSIFTVSSVETLMLSVCALV